MATDQQIKVEKGIPMPPASCGGVTGAKYPWRDMGVGDSFVAVGKAGKQFSSAVQAAQRATGRRFATRTIDGVLRVWRTA